MRETQSDAKRWVFVESEVRSYNETFRKIAGFSLETLIKLRKVTKAIISPSQREVYILDTFADPTVIRELKDVGADGGLAVGLTGNQNVYATDREQKLGFVHGDINQNETWEGIDHWMKENNVKNFDFLFSRAVGGTDEAFTDEVKLFSFIDHLWSRTHQRGGRIIVQIPEILEAKIQTWVSSLKEKKIKASFQPGNENEITVKRHAVLQLIRTKNSPDKLPNFT